MQIFTEKTLPLAAALLQKGELIAFPTETVYGLGGSAFDSEALSKIFIAKGRPSDNPLIVHISSLAQILQLALSIPQELYLLAEAFWPGPLTLIVQKRPEISPLISGRLESVAIRMPNHPLARALISLAGMPLAAPSANLSGKPSSTFLEHVLADFANSIAGVVDGGETELGIESTVLSLLDPEKPLLLRPGSISEKDLSLILKKEIFFPDKDTPILSPGMKYRHYAPRARVVLFQSEEDFQVHLDKTLDKKRLILKEVSAKYLYAQFRLADQQDCEEILVLCTENVRSDAALMNRLVRAALTGN